MSLKSFTSEGEDLPATQQSWEREETVVVGYQRSAGPFQDPQSVDPHGAGTLGPAHQRCTFTEPPRPWSLPGPRDMPERWVPSGFGAVPGRQTGSPTHSVISVLSDALGAQRPPSQTASICMSPRMVITSGTTTPPVMGMSVRYQPSASEFSSPRRQPSPYRRSERGLENSRSAGLFASAGPPYSAGPTADMSLQGGLSVNTVSQGQPPTGEPLQSANGLTGTSTD